MGKVIRVLHVVGRLNIGGAEGRIMDLYRNIDRDKIQFDFMQHMADEAVYQAEVEKMGGHVYHVPRFRVYNYFGYKKSWERFFTEHPEIDIVHGHMTSTAAIYLPIAKARLGAYTIAHARNAGVDRGIKGYMTKWLRRNLSKRCDQCFTCSRLAGEAVFGRRNADRVTTIPNAIDVERFAYNPQTRAAMREQLGLGGGDFVIGHVGRFDTVKNHAYMLEILSACLKKKPSVKLLLVGDGRLRGETEQKAERLGIAKSVIFAGNRKNVYDYYQAFDFFIMPSFYEGLPGTAIEAQASGLHGILSDRITTEAVVTDLMCMKSIDAPPEEWADEILAARTGERTSRTEELRAAGFDVKEQVKRLSDFYLRAVGEGT
ncbi:MAG: glycosyltransferase family 1 protein [Roseburia sp.]|nr:glycosyltransferase family 1 protein [Roseburia sp.]